MYLNDIKVFKINEKELETLIKTKRINSQDVGIEFGLEKCAMLIIKNRKIKSVEKMELPN